MGDTLRRARDELGTLDNDFEMESGGSSGDVVVPRLRLPKMIS